MNALYEAALEIQCFLEQRGWRFCIIGGLAVARWGQPRATQDVDVTLLAGFGEEEPYVTEILGHFTPRLSDAADFAMTNRVLLIRAANAVPIDLALGGIEFERLATERATPFEFEADAKIVTCSAEDLVVMKAFADRPRDWSDVEGILVRQGSKLDWEYVRKQLGPLSELKEAPHIMDRLEQLREETNPA